MLGELLDELVHGGDDQRERCAQVVADVGEEAGLHLVEFSLLPFLPLDVADLPLVDVPVPEEVEQHGADDSGKRQPQGDAPGRQPEGLPDSDVQQVDVFRRGVARRCRAQHEVVVARRQVRQRDAVVCCGQPLFAIAFQQEIVLLGNLRHETPWAAFDEDVFILVVQVERLCIDNVFHRRVRLGVVVAAQW